VDAQGNVFFIDNQTNGLVRRIDARSGIVTVYAGTAAAPTIACSGFYDKYGDGCPANDGMANATATPYGYTAIAKSRGLGIAKNGDLYIADYTGNVVHRISAASGLMNLEAGYIVGNKASSGGTSGYTGDGGPAEPVPAAGATQASVYVTGGGSEVASPRGVGIDSAGNVYVADTGNNVIRKVTAATGIITTIVGTRGNPGFAGDGGPASSALISAPEDVQADTFGNLYIADFANARIRMVYAGGTTAANLIAKTNSGAVAVVGDIYTIMGGGTAQTTLAPGTVVPATSIAVGSPRKVIIDARGNVYLADNGNDVIWFLDATTGSMRVVAGTFGATTGATLCSSHTDAFNDGCPGTTATLNPTSEMGVGIDAAGAVYISDTGDKLVRKVSTNQNFPSVTMGSSTSQVMEIHFAAGDTPAAANPFTITGSADYTIANMGCQAANADATMDCLVTVSFTPTVPGIDNASLTVASTLNGNAAFGITGVGVAPALALDPGNTASFATGLNNAQGIAQDPAGNTYIADTGSNRVLRFSAAGAMTVFAGTGTAGSSGNGGLATAAQLNGPKAVAVTRNGAVFIADTGNNVVRRVDPVTGIITVYGGGATTVCTLNTDSLGDGCPATQAIFSAPSGLAADANSNVFVSDTGNNVIRELTAGGYVALAAGGSAVCSSGAGSTDVFGNGCPPLQAVFNGPTGLQFDAKGDLYIADTGNSEVREITQANRIIAVAGTGSAGGSGNGGLGSGAQLNVPTGVAVDAGGNVYIADTGNSAIRVVNPGGNISTVAGTLGAPGTGTLPGSAFAVGLSSPAGVASNGIGTLVVLDSGNNRAFSDTRSTVAYNFGRTNTGEQSATVQIAETSSGSSAANLGSNSNLFTTTGNTSSFTLTASGSNGCTAGETLNPGTNCLLSAQFIPQTLGPLMASYTDTTTPGSLSSPIPVIQLSGTGATLTPTTSSTVTTTPASGQPQFSGPFVVTTTVTPQSCNTAAPSCVPTGQVTFFADGVQVGGAVPLSATGTASQSIPGLPVGAHSVVAVYSGDDFYGSSTAPTLAVTLAPGATQVAVSASANPSVQFSALTLTAKVTGPIATSIPTGTVSFYNGTALLMIVPSSGPSSPATSGVTPTTGIATVTDSDPGGNPPMPNSFGLVAGTYTITAKYSGDANYAASSGSFQLTIAPQSVTFKVGLSASATGTAQGSTAQTLATITPNNTFGGTITFACTGLPTDSTCTFGPPSNTLTFTPIATRAATQNIQVTLWTNVPPGVVPTAPSAKSLLPRFFGGGQGGAALAATLGWPVLLTSLLGLVGFRKQVRQARLLSLLVLLGVLAGGSAVLTGCSGATTLTDGTTPPGVYTVQLVASGPNSTTVITPITFTVTKGIPGQE
jgi:sugar lactone lactonase YvrE